MYLTHGFPYFKEKTNDFHSGKSTKISLHFSRNPKLGDVGYFISFFH